MKKKPKLNFWQIWNMSFGFLGIQFGFALQNANVSRIFETLGAKIEDIPILWIAAPVTGLLIQPIIGHYSDKTWSRWGRRRPYFLVGAILASLALFVMPNSPALWIAAGMLWIMDACINISMEPFRAFVGDMLPSEQRTKGFAMQSFFIGTGAIVASFLPYILTNWFNIANEAPKGIIPDSVKYSFYLGGAVFILAVLWTVIRTKEYSPEQLKEFAEEEEISKDKHLAEELNSNYESKKQLKTGLIATIVGLIITVVLYFINVEAEVYIFSIGITVYGLIQLISFLFLRKTKMNGLTEIMTDFNNIPKTMKQLAFVQFFSWFALFAMWIYTTAGVTEHIYHTTDATSALYNEGANWVGVAFGIYNGFAAAFAFLLVYMAKKTNRKITHSISLLVGGLSLASIYLINDPSWLLLPFVGIGMAWASILAMPYAILTGALPHNKMGVFMGIFNFFIVIPQILAASLLGFITKTVFHEHAIYALILGGISMLIAAVLVLFVEDKN
ncbi:MAG: MFS transporter [Bacteroidetes bacterium]|nr:MFS transporter [Bacteroidota bacterium]